MDWSDVKLMDYLKATMTNDYIHQLLYFLQLAKTLAELQTQGHQIDTQINNLQNNLHMVNYVPKDLITGNLSSAISQPFCDPNAMNINASIILELMNLLFSASTVSNICKI
jgi:hypothetical protein